MRRLLPFLLWLPRINRTSLREDLVAALTGAFVVLPQEVGSTIGGRRMTGVATSMTFPETPGMS
jgi:SulP family sulfate permease